MPYIDLGEYPQIEWYDRTTLFCFMVCPNSDEERELIGGGLFANLLAKKITEPIPIPPRIFQAGVLGPKLDQLDSIIRTSRIKAGIAGNILLTILRFNKHRPQDDVGLLKAVYIAESQLPRAQIVWRRKDSDFAQLIVANRSGIMNCWKQFKYVSHFWAAMNQSYIKSRKKFGMQSTPAFCQMVAIAEDLRKLAQNAYVKRSKKPVLDELESWKIVESFPLPTADYSLAKPTAEELAILKSYKATT